MRRNLGNKIWRVIARGKDPSALREFWKMDAAIRKFSLQRKVNVVKKNSKTRLQNWDNVATFLGKNFREL